MILNNIYNIFNVDRIDSLINLLLITPFLHYIQMDWVRFSIIALVLGVILVIKEILLIFVIYSKKKSRSSQILWRFINCLIIIPMSYLQFKSKSFVQYNKWFNGINVFYNLCRMYLNNNTIKYSNKKSNKKSKKNKCKKITSQQNIRYFLKTYNIIDN